MGGGCSRYCKADETCGARGRCDVAAGFCRCERFYFGGSCEAGPLAPIESDARELSDIADSAALFWSTGHVLIRANALAMPASGDLTLSADKYGPWVFPSVMKPPAGLHHAGDVVDLHPDGIAVEAGYVVLSTDRFEDANTIYTFNRDILEWVALPTEAEPGDAFKLRANLSHFSTYAVLSPNPAIVVSPLPSPSPLPVDKSDSLNGGEIAGIVIGMVVLLALFLAFCVWFIQRRNRELFADKQPLLPPKQPDPLPTTEELPPAGDWVSCRGCEQPVRTDWPRCPSCHTSVSVELPPIVDSGAGVTATVGFEEPTNRDIDISEVDINKKLEEFRSRSRSHSPSHSPLADSRLQHLILIIPASVSATNITMSDAVIHSLSGVQH
eukprot:1679807-Rhodomonas_salina.1